MRKNLGASADADRAGRSATGAAEASPPFGDHPIAQGFTPGPWAVGYDAQEVYAMPAYKSVCMVLGDVAEGPNNANLIAAAPELYEALNDAADAIGSLDEDALGYAHDAHGEVGWPIRDELMAKIGTALAKARGQ